MRADWRIPRLYAAASLKHKKGPGPHRDNTMYSAALCRGLIEAMTTSAQSATSGEWYSAALCRGLIEAT